MFNSAALVANRRSPRTKVELSPLMLPERMLPDALPLPASVDGVEPDIVRVRSLPVRVVVADPLVSDDDVVPVGFELLPEDGDEEEEACANMRLTAQRAIPLVKARRSRRPEREFGGLIFITRRQTR